MSAEKTSGRARRGERNVLGPGSVDVRPDESWERGIAAGPGESGKRRGGSGLPFGRRPTCVETKAQAPHAIDAMSP